ncbi:anti-sigma F factor [Thalassoglobus neptunius]|uniref:Anti-sigma F factor n=1 Tax=Thalassoglobus neptunius TaxID=1938619 RepID=A0A5C5X9U0_9PLAN|nr:ATP-binding protein [Thalassoglobus neptunius]TWT58622.1 anti-sigma F factor [Thalassoglobus neptunius]
MADSFEFEVTIPSDTAKGHEVQEDILQRLQHGGFPEHDLFGVKLALEEGIVNAIKHGNGLDPNKNVSVHCSYDGERVIVEIEDEGPGFDPGDVPDPTADENLQKPSGRGLMLMKAFMTRVEFNDKGNRVILEKERSAE